jgi:hypothetical protein
MLSLIPKDRTGLCETTTIELSVMRYQTIDGQWHEIIVEKHNEHAVAVQYGAKIALIPKLVETVPRIG